MSVEQGLLFAVLALQLELIDAAQLADACAVWAVRRRDGVALSALMVERGWLTEQDRNDVDRLLSRTLKEHNGDTRAGLRASVVRDPVANDVICAANDPVIRQSLAPSPAERDGIAPPVVDTEPAPDQGHPTTLDYTPPSFRYRLNSVHATGGLGVIWRARDGDLNRDVAYKTIKPESAGHPAARRKFFREAQITGQLEHPNIVPVYEMGRSPVHGELFYAMRLVRGRTLRSVIAEHHRARPPGLTGWSRSVAAERRRLLQALSAVGNAVAFAHARGVLHLDLKPENVLVGDYGEVVLLDWGLARLHEQHTARAGDSLDCSGAAHADGSRADGEPMVTLSGEAAGVGTTAGRVQGTLEYMAPEQAAGSALEFDERTDVYGLGAILYEILSGRPPRDVSGLSTSEALAQILGDQLLTPREINPEVPAALDALCVRALAHDRDGRPARADDLVRELEGWLADEPVATYRAIVAGFEKLVTKHPGTAGFIEQLARNRVALGLVLDGLGRPAEAESSFLAAIDDYEHVAAANPESPAPLADLAATHAHLHRVLLALGRPEEAEAARLKVLATYSALPQLHPADRELYTGLASAYLTMMPGPPPPAVTERGSDVSAAQEPEETILPIARTTEVEGATVPIVVSGRLTLRNLIARGGAAAVFAGFDHDLNREIAVKVLDPRHAGHPDARRRFFREAQITAQLEHPNIVPVYGLGHRSQDEAPFIMMRFIRGQTFSDVIRQHRDSHSRHADDPTGLRRLLKYLVSACDALEYAHSRGVIHRDPKPSNILIGPFGEVLVADWGLAKVVARPEPSNIGTEVQLTDEVRISDTVSGSIFGTPVYMAPEQAAGRNDLIDARADVYILGACLFEILTGQPPNARQGQDFKEILGNLSLRREPPRARSLVADVPTALDAICSKALASDPDDRYPSVRSLADDIERWLADVPVSAFREPLLRRLARRIRRSISSGRRA